MVSQSMASTIATFVLSFSSCDFYIISRLRAVAMMQMPKKSPSRFVRIGIGVAHVGGLIANLFKRYNHNHLQ